MNESMQFTRTHKDTVHPPPREVADWSLQCQMRSSQQGETPGYSSSLHTHTQMTPLSLRIKDYVCNCARRNTSLMHSNTRQSITNKLTGVKNKQIQIHTLQ